MNIPSPSRAAAGAVLAASLIALTSPTTPGQAALAGAPSPHLRDHSNGPVAWLPWGDAAFTKAQEENKLVFASIGYHACHWCRLMDSESFRDPAMAAKLNKEFVCIKVDRQFRPDIDLAFRTYAQSTGNSSGWPLNVWITPGGNPVSVGSYFPVRTKGSSSPGLEKVVAHISKQWRQFPKYVHEQSGRDIEKIRERIARPPLADLEMPEATTIRDRFYSTLSASFDPVSGGFDTGIKFPRPESIETLAAIAQAEKPDSYRRAQIVKMISRTLGGMREGAIIDPLDGGLFRYSNDPSWRVPQFEKILVDQARFANAAIAAYQLTGDQTHADTARGVLSFSSSSLKAPGGGFHASLAADSGTEPSFGAHYLWRADELAALLTPEESAAFTKAFGIHADGNIPPAAKLQTISNGTNIPLGATPEARKPVAGSALAAAIEKVKAARNARPAPPLNGSILTADNGLMVSALSRVGKALDDASLLATAKATADYIVSTLYDADDRSLARAHIDGRNIGNAYLEDYVFLARGLIELHLATGDAKALETAHLLQAIADERFFDSEFGLYHLSPVADKDELPILLWPIHDSDLPSANAYAALNLIDLARLRGTPVSPNIAKVLQATSRELDRTPAACPSATLALLRLPTGAPRPKQ